MILCYFLCEKKMVIVSGDCLDEDLNFFLINVYRDCDNVL